MYQLLDLFSGIGGFSLGLERSGGFKTVAFCESDLFCHKVLAKHWPGVPIYNDVKTLTKDRLDADGISVDAICGGFPCQDISLAGDGAGIEGERSGLWSEYARIICELRPKYVIVENVAALLGRGLYRVLGDLAALGRNAEWHCIPASAVGADHQRDRVWIVSYLNGQRPQGAGELGATTEQACPTITRILAASGFCGPKPAPDMVRNVHGIPCRTHRIKALGNSVYPKIPELIGRAILAAESI